MLILEQLWQGEIAPYERQSQEGSEYQNLSHRATELQLEVYKALSTEGKKAFDEYNDIELELTDISEQDSFIKGVRIGARMMIDILGEYPSPLPQMKK